MRDFSSSYFALNQIAYVKKIQEAMSSIPHKYLVCIGSSAGVFASMLMGQILQADIVFAFQARTQAFCYDIKEFHRQLQLEQRLFTAKDIDIGYLQHINGGFHAKTYAVLCENKPSDIISILSLDHTDPNLHISYCHGDTHDALLYLGAKNIYTEMTRVIEKELAHDFNLPIQTDIFTHLEGYKYNSITKLLN